MPGWDYGLVCFLDVLGFSSYVLADSRSPIPEHLEKLLGALAEVQLATVNTNVDVRAFSDSIILSAPLGLQSVHDLLSVTVRLQRIFVSRGVLVRGAIAFGKHFADSSSIYSEALITAYHLERDHARFPRVLVDRNLLDWFLNDVRLDRELRVKSTAFLRSDRDNQVFLHYLDRQLVSEHEALLRSYENTRLTASVLEKVQWLAEYHNYAVGNLEGELPLSLTFLSSFRPVD
jgi:hypothetical protein